MSAGILSVIRDVLRNNRMSKQKDRVENAVRTLAQAQADAEFHRVMANHYTLRAGETDPQVDWWGYAENKQKEQDHVESHAVYSRKAFEANAMVKAEQARYVRLLDGPGVAGAEDQT